MKRGFLNQKHIGSVAKVQPDSGSAVHPSNKHGSSGVAEESVHDCSSTLRDAARPEAEFNFSDVCRIYYRDPYVVVADHRVSSSSHFLYLPSENPTMVFIDSFEGVQSLAKWEVLKTSCAPLAHPPFTIEDSGEEKGMGMFATRPIARGDLIMRERPFYVSHPALTVNEDQRHIFHASALAGLSPTAQAALAALRNAHPVSPDMPPARGRLLTNALPAEVPHAPGSRHAALYPVLCRANHACTPNARYGFDADACAGRLVALHDIAPGEEITIGYTEVAAPRDTRRAALREKYRFECECATCELPKGSAKESDARRAAIRKYMTGMLEGERFLDRVDIAHAKELIAWAEEEGLVEAVTVLAISAMRVARRKKDFLEEFRQVVNVAYYIRTVEGKDSALFAQLARRMGLSTKQLAALLENSTPETLDYGMFHGLLTARANR